MNITIDALAAYGADIEGTLARFLDDRELYCECVITFKNDPSFELLGKQISEGDFVNAYETAHCLKGVSANLGLLPLLHPITALSDQFKNGDYSNPELLYKNVMTEYDRFVAIFDK